MNERSRWLKSLQRSLQEWIRLQDEQEVLQASALGAWMSFAAVMGLILAAALYAPGASELFALPPGPALACVLPTLVCGLVFSLLHRRRQHLEWWGWLIISLGTGLVHFCQAALAALSAMPGAVVFAALYLFTVTSHGRLHRVTLRHPYLAVTTLLALLAALTLRRSDQHLALFVIVGLAALSGQLYLGTFAVKHDQTRAEAERLRAAVQAQMLDQQERDMGRLSDAMMQILGYNHDIANVLMSAGTAADMLEGMDPRQPSQYPEYRELVQELRQGLGRIRSMVLEIRQHGRRTMHSEPEPVAVGPLLESVRDSLHYRYPEVEVALEVEEAARLRVQVRGGQGTLRRVVENLMLNACEGNGQQGATRVQVRAQRGQKGVELAVEDDGPGFREEQLAGPIEGLSTTKVNGTGLGLYTSERLVRASGGRLVRSNRPGGGASVRINLPGGVA